MGYNKYFFIPNLFNVIRLTLIKLRLNFKRKIDKSMHKIISLHHLQIRNYLKYIDTFVSKLYKYWKGCY